MSINTKLIDTFIKEASQKLKGEWVLIGGALMHAIGRDLRVTTDIDFISKGESSSSDTLLLMEIAESLGLPVEAINQAGSFFLKKIKGFEKELIPIHESKSVSIYRPNLYLYIRLKIARLSESDLSDCLEYINYTRESGEDLLREKCIERIQEELDKGDHRFDRLQKLLEAFEK